MEKQDLATAARAIISMVSMVMDDTRQRLQDQEGALLPKVDTKALKELVGILKEAGNMLSEWEEQAHPVEDVSFSEEQTTGVIILPEVKQESE